MKNSTLKHWTAFVLLFGGTVLASAQSTAFTYQGRLNAGGSPATGVYDFTFQAFDAISAGASIGGTVSVNAVGVTNGLFTALVDLGPAPFTGPPRWLQIGVSTNGAGSFILLTPRQALTPSPYAIYAGTAGTVTNGGIANAQLAANAVAAGNVQNAAITAGKIASGQVVKSLNGLSDAVSITQGANVTINTVGNSLQISAPAGGLNLPFSGSAASAGSVFTVANTGVGPAALFQGKVGVGTLVPTHTVHIAAGAPAIALQDTNAASQQAGYVSYRDNGNVERAWVGYGTAGSPDFSIVNARAGGNIVLLPFSGNVGIGSTAPAAKLEVHGDIRLGPSGQFRAASGEENLRIIRGTVDRDGSILLGSGFSVTHTNSGEYTIHFTTPFTSPPTVTTTSFDTLQALVFLPSTSSVFIETSDVGPRRNSGIDAYFHFIAIGPR